jgi:hypothetical protein
MGLHCKIPEFLKTHIRSERKRKTDFATVSDANAGPEKTDQTQRLQKVYSLPEGDLATPVKSAANPMTGRKKIKAKYYQKPSPSQLDPQSRNAPRAPPPNLSLHRRIRRGTPPPAKLLHHGEALISFGRQTQHPQRRIRFVPPPSPVKPNHHGETSLTSLGRQTQHPQRRIRFVPPPSLAKPNHHGEAL